MKKLVTVTHFGLQKLVTVTSFLVLAAPLIAAPLPRVPEGFAVELAAGEEQVVFPMFACFDDYGRLFVAESSGLDLYAEVSALTRKCKVRCLEDRDGDGRFERSRVFIDRLVYPMGLAWRDGRLYVADPPELAAYRAGPGDERGEERQTLLGNFGHQDNGSLHGVTFGPDGLLYMTMGSPDGYRIRTESGAILEGESGALIRCRSDGSRPEVLCRGFVNLVEIAFLPGGEIIGTDNWFQQPEGGFRDALIQLVEGGLYPSHPDAGTAYPVTGVPLPAVSRFPAVALSGLLCYRGRNFPPEFHGNLFSAQHNARKVGRHALSPEGSTFRSRDFDFATSDDPDFHPSDVIEDAGGSLLVIDTGGWYVQHCPTGRIRDSRAPGGLYRVRFQETAPVDGPREAKIAWEKDGVEALAILQRQLESGDPELAKLAARALGLKGGRAAAPALARLLSHPDPQVELAAAEALARCGESSITPFLWKALEREVDAFLEHALVHALYRLASLEELERALQSASPRAQRAALLILDQPPRRKLRLESISSALAEGPEGPRRAALEILLRHAEWAGAARGLIIQWLDQEELPGAAEKALSGLLRAFHGQAEIAEELARRVREAKGGGRRRLLVLEALADSPPLQLAGSWPAALSACLENGTAEVRRGAVKAIAALELADFTDKLLQIAGAPSEPAELRLEALHAALAWRLQLSPPLFELLLGQLAPEKKPLERLAAAEAMAQAKLSEAQLGELFKAIRGDPLISPSLLAPALQRSAGPPTAIELADYLAAALSSGWRPAEAELRKLLAPAGEAARGRAAELVENLRQANAGLRARLEEFEPLLEGGDAARGRDVFFAELAACSTCHRIGGEGGRIGPDLTRIGAVRSGRDLLESILFPSSTFAQGYDNYLVILTNGRVLSGLMVEQGSDRIVLRDARGAEMGIRKSQIAELERQSTSIMPEGLERTMSREEMRDLLAFLKN